MDNRLLTRWAVIVGTDRSEIAQAVLKVWKSLGIETETYRLLCKSSTCIKPRRSGSDPSERRPEIGALGTLVREPRREKPEGRASVLVASRFFATCREEEMTPRIVLVDGPGGHLHPSFMPWLSFFFTLSDNIIEISIPDLVEKSFFYETEFFGPILIHAYLEQDMIDAGQYADKEWKSLMNSLAHEKMNRNRRGVS
jgi:hypothetical protein